MEPAAWHIGFTGTRHGMTSAQWQGVYRLMGLYRAIVFHHGDCVGADYEADMIARTWFVDKLVIHPPVMRTLRAYCQVRGLPYKDEILPEKPYEQRNRDIVQASDLVIAAPPSEQEQPFGGTWQTVRLAREYNKPCKVVLPSGIVVDA